MAHFEPAPTDLDVVSDLDTREVARELIAGLGQPLVALLTDVSSTRVVGSWVDGVDPEAPREAILRYALRALHILTPHFDTKITQQWFVGSNSSLADSAPSAILRKTLEDGDRIDEIGPLVLNAARTLVTASSF